MVDRYRLLAHDVSESAWIPGRTRLLSVRNESARQFYETEALQGGWSVRQLDRCPPSYRRKPGLRDCRARVLAGIDYRHVISSLVRKPGAFARYRYREQMFPTGTFRLAYDALREWRGERADVDYVRILHLAATTMESEVDRALGLLLEAGTPFDYAAVRELAAPAQPQVPELASPRVVDLRVYDRLLAAGVR